MRFEGEKGSNNDDSNDSGGQRTDKDLTRSDGKLKAERGIVFGKPKK